MEDSKTGSTSLSTQEQILQKKLLEMSEYSESEVIQLVDNGYSGTTFDRPSLNKLMEMVKCQQVACIMVKDFSRLGRDMMQVGYLTESVFPLFYTRIVAVTDGYDSNDHYESTGGLEVAFRFLMSEHYSKDLGKKISVAKQSKIQKGKLVTKHPFYGYKLNENREYIINEDVADNVRLIYKLAIEGLTLREIGLRLQDLKIPTPSSYRNQFNSKYHPCMITGDVWNVAAISVILHNVRYTGVYTKGSYSGVLSKHECEKNGDVYIENHHPPIISNEDFEKVQERFCSSSVKMNIAQYPMKSKLFCGICGHRLEKIRTTKVENSNFVCKKMFSLEECACQETKVSLQFLCSEVLATMKSRIVELAKIGATLTKGISTGNNASKTVSPIEKTKVNKKVIYESFVNGELSKEQYLKEKDILDRQIEKLIAIHESALNNEKNSSTSKCKLSALKNMENEILEATELSIDLAEKYAKKITVFPDNSLNIEFMFDELFKNM